MAYTKYALVKGGFVFNIIVMDNPTQEELDTFKDIHNADSIVEEQTGCCIGAIWDGETFTPPRPYDSWVWNTALKTWEAPVAYPTPSNLEDLSKNYMWNEPDLRWDLQE